MYKTLLFVAFVALAGTAAGQVNTIMNLKLALERNQDSSLINESTVRYLSAGPSNTRISTYDALIWGYAQEQTGTVKDTNLLTLHSRTFSTQMNDTVQLLVRGKAGRSYFLHVTNFLAPAGFQLKLKDLFTNTTVALLPDLRYGYQVTADPASQGTGRFQLVVQSPATLAIAFCGLPALSLRPNGVSVTACLYQDEPLRKVVLEKAKRGEAFRVVAQQTGQAVTGRTDYVFVDENASQEACQYRVSAQAADGHWIYSGVVEQKSSRQQVRLYPNPTTDYLMLGDGLAQPGVQWQILDAAGSARQQQTVNQQGAQRISVATLSPGLYRLVLVDRKGQVTGNYPFVKQ